MKQSEKALVNLLKLRKSNKNLQEILDSDRIQEMMDDDSSLYEDKEPTQSSRNKYVGVEIECFSSCEEADLALDFYEANLEDKVTIGADGSIDVEGDDDRDYEIRVMDTEQNIGKTLRKVFKILKNRKFKVNDSCGLHVHLDCRHRSKDKVFGRLIKAQILLFGLVGQDRLDNTYCKWSNEQDKHDKYRAINYASGRDTVEVRLHHATMDANQVVNWVNLLVKLANHKKDKGWFRTPQGVRKRIKISPSLSKYLKETYVARARGVDYDAAGF